MKDQGQKWIFGAVGLLVGVLLTVGYYNLGAVNGESVQGKLGNVVPGQGKVNDTLANPQVNSALCWDLYKAWVNNSMTAYMTQNNLSNAYLSYCTNSVIGTKQWYSQAYTEAQCTNMYNAWKRTMGGVDFSSWLQKNNIPLEASTYCYYKMGNWYKK